MGAPPVTTGGGFFKGPTMTEKTRRVHFYIDAFNVWHRIKEHRKSGGKDYRWLDYVKVCRNIVLGNKPLFDGGELGRVAFFTVQPPEWWEEGKRDRHQTLVRALRKTGVEVVDRGYFTITDEVMRNEKTGEILLDPRGKVIRRPRVNEKQTDASIVARMVGDAARDAAREKFGLYVLFSGDNDLAPALDEARKFKQSAGIVLPPVPDGRNRKDKNLENATSQNNDGAALIVRMRFKNFDGCCLPQNSGSDEQGEIIMPEVYGKF